MMNKVYLIFKLFFEQLSHTSSLYSNKGRINDSNIRSRACLHNLNFKDLLRLSLDHTLLRMLFICSDHVHELLKMIPRCLRVVCSDLNFVHFERWICCRYSFPRY